MAPPSEDAFLQNIPRGMVVVKNFVPFMLCVSLSAVLMGGCQGESSETSSTRKLSNPAPSDDQTGNSSGNSGNALCDDFLKTIDTDSDGIKDYYEIWGACPLQSGATEAGPCPDGYSGEKFRSDPRVADTDADGRNDGDELKNRKITGDTSTPFYTQDVLRNVVATNPNQRDFLLLVFAVGAQNGVPRLNANLQPDARSGWNGYGGLGTTDSTRVTPLPSSDEIVTLKAFSDQSLVMRTRPRASNPAERENVIPETWLPNKCRQNPSEENCTCWQGHPDQAQQGGCQGVRGNGQLYGSNNAVETPNPECSINPNNLGSAATRSYYVCAFRSMQNSLIGRLSRNGQFLGGTPPNYTNTYDFIDEAYAFRIGSVGTATGQQLTTIYNRCTRANNNDPVCNRDNLPYYRSIVDNQTFFYYGMQGLVDADYLVRAIGAQGSNQWELPYLDGRSEHLLLRMQDTNAGVSDNSGFNLVQVTFKSQRRADQWAIPAADDSAANTAIRNDFYDRIEYRNQCKLQ